MARWLKAESKCAMEVALADVARVYAVVRGPAVEVDGLAGAFLIGA